MTPTDVPPGTTQPAGPQPRPAPPTDPRGADDDAPHRTEDDLPHTTEDDVPADVATSAALIAEQRARVEEALDVDPRLLLGAWGIAWLLGFGVLWAVALDEPLIPLSRGAGFAVFGCLLIAAMVLTTVHASRHSAGLRGPSALQGAMYGWAWFLVFAGVAALMYALVRLDVAPEVYTTVTVACSALVVGALYMAGGAIWRDRTQFALGAWVCLATIAALVVGYPHLLAVMAVLGGGGMLTTALVETVRRR